MDIPETQNYPNLFRMSIEEYRFVTAESFTRAPYLSEDALLITIDCNEFSSFRKVIKCGLMTSSHVSKQKCKSFR